jgi:drug/metabolite transporter (DMT)-like permease
LQGKTVNGRWYGMPGTGYSVLSAHVARGRVVASWTSLSFSRWNAAVKVGLDRFSSVLLLAIVQALIAIPILPWVDQPLRAAWPWILASALLHVGYKVLLVHAYAHGDLSQVYPIARGTAPIIVATITVVILGESIGTSGMFAVAAIAAGVILMSFKGGAMLDRMQPRAVLYALGTAGFTAGYTLVDGVGARVAGTASGFILWMVIGDAIGMIIFAAAARGRLAFAGLRSAWLTGLVAGALSLGSYWVAVWAMTEAPIALIAALRETSVLFALVIGAAFLKEPLTPWRRTAALLIAAGVVAIRL